MLTPVTVTRLEKAATDNGFDLDLGRAADWLQFGSSQTSMRIWLTAIGDSLFLVAASRADVLEALAGLGVTFTHPLPDGAAGARSVSDVAALHRLVRRAFQLARTLPDALLRAFENETANLPRSTEVERLVVQRAGQDVFRRGLLEYWDGRCAVSGLSVADLLRASHIKPWADCANDAERLDVFNGLLLGPHLDAAFDAGFLTVAEDGAVVVSDALPPDARALLGLDPPLKVRGLHPAHERYLPWHRAKEREMNRECPGVDPDALMRWRVASRATFQQRDPAALIADVEAAMAALRAAPRIEVAPGLWAADMRRPEPVRELPEAAARLDLAYVSGPLIGPDGRHKYTVSGDSDTVRAWMAQWAPSHGIVGVYGDPARGFAGGYDESQ